MPPSMSLSRPFRQTCGDDVMCALTRAFARRYLRMYSLPQYHGSSIAVWYWPSIDHSFTLKVTTVGLLKVSEVKSMSVRSRSSLPRITSKQTTPWNCFQRKYVKARHDDVIGVPCSRCTFVNANPFPPRCFPCGCRPELAEKAENLVDPPIMNTSEPSRKK